MSYDSPRLAILADDLTGAADSAARAVRAGLRACVVFAAAAWRVAPVDVVALTTDSRHLSPTEAAARVAAAVGELGAAEVWYKKIDSTLRGNIGAELEALLAALPDPSMAAVVCPAFPAQGRGLADGYLVHGGAAPHTPHLPRLLAGQTSLPVAALGLATVRSGAVKLATALNRARRGGARLLVVDAVSGEDLALVVAAAQSAGMLLCGSAGMVGPLAERLAHGVERQARASMVVSPGPILFVVGSGSAMAHRQIVQLTVSGYVRRRQVAASWIGVDLAGAQSRPVGDWLLHLAPLADGTTLEGAAARAFAANLADLTQTVTARLQPAALVVVGGDTAHFVLRGLGMRRLDVVEELLPGIPLALATGRDGVTRAVVLKPGSFGDERVLVTLLEQLHQRQPSLSAAAAVTMPDD